MLSMCPSKSPKIATSPSQRRRDESIGINGSFVENTLCISVDRGYPRVEGLSSQPTSGFSKIHRPDENHY